MDKDIIEVFLNLNKKEFESVEKRANQESIDSDPNDEEMKNGLYFERATIQINDLYVEDKSDEILLNGNLFAFGKNLGWMELKIPLNQEMAVQIIDRYMKKLGKLKTVLEATKD
ncbi:MAG TPA: hypothetical protein ENI61_00710 [Ignavibacteria bacterium]|nr:hypothetical protein [Ignavibacteria bacterium]